MLPRSGDCRCVQQLLRCAGTWQACSLHLLACVRACVRACRQASQLPVQENGLSCLCSAAARPRKETLRSAHILCAQVSTLGLALTEDDQIQQESALQHLPGTVR